MMYTGNDKKSQVEDCDCDPQCCCSFQSSYCKTHNILVVVRIYRYGGAKTPQRTAGLPIGAHSEGWVAGSWGVDQMTSPSRSPVLHPVLLVISLMFAF